MLHTLYRIVTIIDQTIKQGLLDDWLMGWKNNYMSENQCNQSDTYG